MTYGYYIVCDNLYDSYLMTCFSKKVHIMCNKLYNTCIYVIYSILYYINSLGNKKWKKFSDKMKGVVDKIMKGWEKIGILGTDKNCELSGCCDRE